MQNISKNLKPITIMEKIEEYAVFKYEDEFGFHYMIMDKLPGGDLHTWSPSRSGRRSTPTVLRELSLVSHFRRTANRLMCSTPNSSPWRVGGQTRETFWSGRKGPGFTEPSRNWKGKDLKLEKAIEPIREAYNRLSPSRRSMFIAQVIYLLIK